MKAYLVETGYLMKKDDFKKECDYDHYSTCYDKKIAYYDNGQYYRDKSDWKNALESGLHEMTDYADDGTPAYGTPAYCIISVTDIDDDLLKTGDIKSAIADMEVEGEDYLPENVMFSVRIDRNRNIEYNFIEGQQTDRILTLNAEHFMNGYLLGRAWQELFNLPADGSKVINMSVSDECVPVKVMFTKDSEYTGLDEEGKPDAYYGNMVSIDFLYQRKNIASTYGIHMADLLVEFDQILSGSTEHFIDDERTLFQIVDEAVEQETLKKEQQEEIER